MGKQGKEIVGLKTLESIIRDSFPPTCLGFSQFTKSTCQSTFLKSITRNSIHCAIVKSPEFYYQSIKKPQTCNKHTYICITQSRLFIFPNGLGHAEDGGVSMGHFCQQMCVVLFLSFPSYMFFGQKSGPADQICSPRGLCE